MERNHRIKVIQTESQDLWREPKGLKDSREQKDLRDSDIREGLSGKVKMTLDIFTDDWFLVMTGNIVPFNPVAVEVVENGHAGLTLT